MGLFRNCPCFRPREEAVKLLDFSHYCLEGEFKIKRTSNYDIYY